MTEQCKSCQCSRCDNNMCDWQQCETNQPTKECYQNDCGQYYNIQEDIEEGFLDGYDT